MIRRPPRSTQGVSSAASDVYKRQVSTQSTWGPIFFYVENCDGTDRSQFDIAINVKDPIQHLVSPTNLFIHKGKQKTLVIPYIPHKARSLTLNIIAEDFSHQTKKLGSVELSSSQVDFKEIYSLGEDIKELTKTFNNGHVLFGHDLILKITGIEDLNLAITYQFFYMEYTNLIPLMQPPPRLQFEMIDKKEDRGIGYYFLKFEPKKHKELLILPKMHKNIILIKDLDLNDEDVPTHYIRVKGAEVQEKVFLFETNSTLVFFGYEISVVMLSKAEPLEIEKEYTKENTQLLSYMMDTAFDYELVLKSKSPMKIFILLSEVQIPYIDKNDIMVEQKVKSIAPLKISISSADLALHNPGKSNAEVMILVDCDSVFDMKVQKLPPTRDPSARGDIHIDLQHFIDLQHLCLLYTSPSPRDLSTSRMPSSA
eukprot:TRINITY_DN1010_c0_g1_i1.p1 TRINITY_DN1010_c0_g1~~TRINITY_DN1010_c0_g1_i1.p1  ORF type:complete len:425 (+),score=82.62 TRINITY_DN1010_c0_g1_i1:109-1383(+)